MNSHDKKLEFLHRIAKLGTQVQNFDAGGTVLNGPSAGAVNTNASTGSSGTLASNLGLADTFQAAGANVQAGTNSQQLNNAYTGVQGALTGQQALANTLSPQAQAAKNQQAALAAQLQARAAGQGPNPAQAALNNATGANVANQAALMAGQRGASSNVGLIARQAAQQGATTQQQAVGQGAQMQAEQQIAAQNALGNLSAQEASQAAGATNSATQAQQAEQNILQGANTAYNNAAVGMQSNINNVNAQTALANQQENNGVIGGLTSALGHLPVVSGLFKAEGGEIATAPEGNMTNPTSRINTGWGRIILKADGGPVPSAAPAESGAQSFVGQWLTSPMQQSGPNIEPTNIRQQKQVPLFEASNEEASSEPQSTGDKQLDTRLNSAFNNSQTLNQAAINPSALTEAFAKGGATKKLAGDGGKVKAASQKQKATVKGDSYANDKVPAMLSEGEVVIPRHVMQSADPAGNAAKFVQAVLAKKGLRK